MTLFLLSTVFSSPRNTLTPFGVCYGDPYPIVFSCLILLIPCTLVRLYLALASLVCLCIGVPHCVLLFFGHHVP